MADLVGSDGYAATTVANVLALAGVSRKAFYKHFANKQECFLAAYDAIAADGRREVSRTYEAAGRRRARQLAIAKLFERAIDNPGNVRMALIEAGVVGQAGIERPRAADERVEGLLRDMLGLPPGPARSPTRCCEGSSGSRRGVSTPTCARTGCGSWAIWCRTWCAGRPPNPPPTSMMRLLTQPTNGHPLPPGLIGGRRRAPSR